MKKIISLLLVAAMALALVGCGAAEKPTAESLMENMPVVMEGYKYVKAHETLEFGMGLNFLGQNSEMSMSADLNVESAGNVSHTDGMMNMDSDGEKQESALEAYSVYDEAEKSATTYTRGEDGEWMKATAEGYGSSENVFAGKFQLKDMALAENTETFNGVECYKVTGKLAWSDVQNIMSDIQGLDEFFTDSAIEGADFNLEFFFDKSSKEPVGLKLEGKDAFEKVVNAVFEEQVGFSLGIKVSAFNVSIEIKEKKANGEVKVPADVIESAVDYTEDYEFVQDEYQEPADITATEDDLDIQTYVYGDMGSTVYIMAITNNSFDDVCISVNGTARDADGKMLSVSDGNIPVLGAGQTGLCYMYFDTDGIDHVDTDISMSAPEYYIDMASDFTYEENVNNDKVLLAVTNESEFNADEVDVYILFFDEEGNVVGYDSDCMYDDDYEFKAGKTMNTQLQCWADEFDHYEIFICAYRNAF